MMQQSMKPFIETGKQTNKDTHTKTYRLHDTVPRKQGNECNNDTRIQTQRDCKKYE